MNNLRPLPSPRAVPQDEHDRAADRRDPLPDAKHVTRDPLPDRPLPHAKHVARDPLPESPRYEPDHEAPARRSYAFAHQKLEVYRVALEMARRSRELADRVPRGYRPFADQLLRAAGHTVLLMGEGANRYTSGQKRQRYTEARGQSGETASAAELLAALRLVPDIEARRVQDLAGRVASMLTRLIQRYS